VLSGNARERLAEAPLEKIIVTNTIPQNDPGPLKNLVVCSVAPMIAEAINRVHTHRSVSEMFD
jgi:ribose-phosphate pyrophosphokinase